MFPRTSGLRSGYDPDEVDDFFAHARRPTSRAPPARWPRQDVRGVAFDLKRGGYVTAAVDAALDRLEVAFVARARAEFVAEHGQEAWMEQLGEQARTLYGRLGRPDGDRFAPPERSPARATSRPRSTRCATASSRTSTRARRSRPPRCVSATFRARKGRNAYDEATVDAFFARAVDVLLGVE